MFFENFHIFEYLALVNYSQHAKPTITKITHSYGLYSLITTVDSFLEGSVQLAEFQIRKFHHDFVAFLNI